MVCCGGVCIHMCSLPLFLSLTNAEKNNILDGRADWEDLLRQVWSEARSAINTSSVCGDDNHKPQQLNQNLAKAFY